MEKEHFRVSIKNTKDIYYQQLSHNVPVSSYFMGIKRLQYPLYAVWTILGSYAGQFCAESFITGEEKLLMMPSDIRKYLLPAPPSIFDNYPIDITSLKHNQARTIDTLGDFEYDMDFGIESPKEPLLVMRVSFGMDALKMQFRKILPEHKWAVFMNHSKMKPVGTVYEFGEELHNYAKLLECFVNGFYEELGRAMRQYDTFSRYLQMPQEPGPQKILTWSAEDGNRVVLH